MSHPEIGDRFISMGEAKAYYQRKEAAEKNQILFLI